MRTRQDWTSQIQELQEFYDSANLPSKGRVKLNDCSTVVKPKLFFRANLAYVKHNQGKPRFDVYLNRLIKFKDIWNNK